MRVVNHQRWPLALEDGTILAAAGTNGSTKEIASLSDRDFRHVGAGRIAIVVEGEQPASPEGQLSAEVAAVTDEEPAGNAPEAVESAATPIGNFIEVGKPETKPRPRGGRTNG